MYPNLTMPRPPSSVITDRLAARAQPPIGVATDTGDLQFNGDVMHQIIRIVVVSGERSDICFLAQAHPYFFRETDLARVHGYLEKQIRLLKEDLPAAEFHARFTAVLRAMHAAEDRLPMDARLYFLIHLADGALNRDGERQGIREGLLATISRAGTSLGLDPQSRTSLLMLLMTGHSGIPDFERRRYHPLHIPLCKAELLENSGALPEAECNALALLADFMSRKVSGDEQAAWVFTASSLSRVAGWPHAWQAAMLHCIVLRLSDYPGSTRLQLATQLFNRMCELPKGQRDVVLMGLIEFIRGALVSFFGSNFCPTLLEQIPVWLSACNGLANCELNFLVVGISDALASMPLRSSNRDVALAAEVKIKVLTETVIALSLSIPPDQRSGMPFALLALATKFMDAPERISAFKNLWDGAVRQDGLFACLYKSFRSPLLTHCSAVEIANFLHGQVALLPNAEQCMVVLPICVMSQPGPLRFAVVEAILAQLPTVAPHLRAEVMSELLWALSLTSGNGPVEERRGWSSGLGTDVDAFPSATYINAIRAQLLLLDDPGTGVSFADTDTLLKRIIECLPLLGDAVLQAFLQRATGNFDSMLLSRSQTYLLENSARMSLASQRMVALSVLYRIPPLFLGDSWIDDPSTEVVWRAFQIVNTLPSAVKAEALYMLCKTWQLWKDQESTGDTLFKFVLAESTTLPVQERGRLLYALADREVLLLPHGLPKLDMLWRQAGLLDADIREAWLILIDLKLMNPRSTNADTDYARFLGLRERCAGITDPVQLSTVMSEMNKVEARFRKKGFPRDGLASGLAGVEERDDDYDGEEDFSYSSSDEG